MLDYHLRNTRGSVIHPVCCPCWRSPKFTPLCFSLFLMLLLAIISLYYTPHKELSFKIRHFLLYFCPSFFFFFFKFLFVVNFVIHWNEKALGSHVFPIPIPPPTSLPTLRHKSQQDPLWPTSQNIRNKTKNKQMGPNET